jgi:mRNA interferase MazF
VQSDRLRLSTVLVAPTSTQARPARHRVLVDIDRMPTQVLLEQIHAVDVDALGQLVGLLSPEAMDDVRAAIDVVLDR